MSSFEKLNLSSTIVNTIKKQGYVTPTPIQNEAIPHLLKGRDMLGIAQTGTGKTAAFSLPIIDNLLQKEIKTNSRNVRALILTPTRELASQIKQSINSYTEEKSLFCGVIFGGVGKKGQIDMMARGSDVLVATPGRLLDLISDGFIKFDQLEVFVLDEADRMLDMGFIHDVKKIIALLPDNKQTMLFSATMPKTISSLAKSLLKDPVKVEVTPESSTVDKIDQRIYMVEKADKLRLLKSTLEDKSLKSVLVFTRTKHMADRLCKELIKSKIESAAIHGNKSQGARQKALKSFQEEKIRVLIATDIAARGIDIDHITHVVNYNLPEDAESYVHRIGRTARAGREGVAISFCEATEVKFLKNIEKFIKIKIPIDSNHDYHIIHTKESILSEEKAQKEQKEKRLAQRRKSKPKIRNSQNAKSGNIRTKKAKDSKGRKRTR